MDILILSKTKKKSKGEKELDTLKIDVSEETGSKTIKGIIFKFLV